MYAVSSTTPLWPHAAALLTVSFAVNWVWEVVQMAAYSQVPGRLWREEVFFCTLAAAGDAVLTIFVFAAVAAVKRFRRWTEDDGLKAYGAAALAGGALAVFIEWAALGAGYWSYAPGMPRVPLLGVGLLPFAQLTLLVPFSLWAAGHLWVWFSGNSSHV